ncbi:zinc ribbon domain-containing protein [Leptolyngbya sp. 7M]|uniref:zinc ribbon domain-containing protein n=1 Tax=Leptolyngbya sp. 7M TaxID=2812896 RepID=UPI001B8D624E|nr:zinc ribbon domain-containing protein [Leptolyngbya sp. 7M]QYO64349.1 transposase [Leptolyngbya sp. 7M]
MTELGGQPSEWQWLCAGGWSALLPYIEREPAVAKIRDAYGNSPASGFTMDFFALNAPGANQAYLASPFVSTFKPVSLLTERGCNVRLLVRLCSITPPQVIRQALADPNVTLRYYTSRSFHAKLYIIDDIALVGSANLTDSGLMTNREVSVVLRKERDPAFDDLPAMFNLFWDYADTMTPEICSQYEQAFKAIGNAKEEAAFQAHLEKFVGAATPPSAKVGSDRISARRSFIQGLRRKYDEQLIPAFQEVEEIFLELGKRRPEFADADPEIELGRFLGWLRIARAPGDSWQAVALLDRPQRHQRIAGFLEEWHDTEDTAVGDMFQGENEVANINRLRAALASPDTRLILVGPAYTSQTCHKCLHIHSVRGESYRSGKTFSCGHCGWHGDADLNGAKNISVMGYFLAVPRGSGLACSLSDGRIYWLGEDLGRKERE